MDCIHTQSTASLTVDTKAGIEALFIFFPSYYSFFFSIYTITSRHSFFSCIKITESFLYFHFTATVSNYLVRGIFLGGGGFLLLRDRRAISSLRSFSLFTFASRVFLNYFHDFSQKYSVIHSFMGLCVHVNWLDRRAGRTFRYSGLLTISYLIIPYTLYPVVPSATSLWHICKAPRRRILSIIMLGFQLCILSYPIIHFHLQGWVCLWFRYSFFSIFMPYFEALGGR